MFRNKEETEETERRSWRLRGKGKKSAESAKKGDKKETEDEHVGVNPFTFSWMPGDETHQEDTRNDTTEPRPSSSRDEAEKKKKKKWKLLNKAVAVERADAKELEADPALSRSRSSGSNFSLHDKRQAKAVVCQFGSNPKEVFKIIKEDGIPSPEQPDHVLVRIQASTVTLNDCLLRRGLDFDVVHPSTLPMVPGYDIVGRIVAVGQDIKDFKEGDKVAALIRTGGNARYASVLASSLVRVPRTMDPTEAVCMVSVFSTAYRSLQVVTEHGPMFSLKEKKVLIIGGMQSVGQALIQMCNKARATVYATVPEGRRMYVRQVLGAYPLPQSASEWLPIVEGEMDVVFDGTCEDGLDAASKALVEGGQLVSFGHASMLKEEMGLFGAPLSAHFNKLRSHIALAKSVDIWEFFHENPEAYKKNLSALFQLLKWNKLRPFIARRIPLSDVPFAHAKLEQGNVRGCVVCVPWRHLPNRKLYKPPTEDINGDNTADGEHREK